MIDIERYATKTRTARKAHRCVGAAWHTGWRVHHTSTHGHGWTSAASREEADSIAARLVGAVSNQSAHTGEVTGRYLTAEVVPIVNPNYNPDCMVDIPPGARYVEYLGESQAWESGARYCAVCALAAWGIAVE